MPSVRQTRASSPESIGPTPGATVSRYTARLIKKTSPVKIVSALLVLPKGIRFVDIALSKMVRLARLERATYSSGGWRSIQLSYRRKLNDLTFITDQLFDFFQMFGVHSLNAFLGGIADRRIKLDPVRIDPLYSFFEPSGVREVIV